jgi:cysteinyl-tRNA synthetase
LAQAAFQAYAKSNLPLLIDPEGPELDVTNYIPRRDAAYGTVLAGGSLSGEKPGDAEAKLKMHISNMTQAVIAMTKNSVFGMADEILLPYLDSLYKETIDTSDQTMFTDLTRTMEHEFEDDMDNLNVLRPDVVTRVTEYVPQIVKFVERVVKKGFAYEAEGSVYFDIAAFEKAGNAYAKLRPESRNDKTLQEEGEGALSKGVASKKGSGDFALWKKSKAGEPFWPSPWGDGRPGWHIEVSIRNPPPL